MLAATREDVEKVFRGRHVAIVGSGPGSLDNDPGFVDSHDVVVRCNNYRTGPAQGFRTDVFYSFFGGSIKKTRDALIADGVRLCMCKVPNAQPIESAWHRQHNKMNGVDFSYIYRARASFWFCPTFVPTVEHFLEGFNLLGGHIPTTGFAAILDVLRCKPASCHLTGFDGFTSLVHNVDEVWRAGDPTDPIGHVPHAELQWLRDNQYAEPLTFDPRLAFILEG